MLPSPIEDIVWRDLGHDKIKLALFCLLFVLNIDLCIANFGTVGYGWR